MDLEEHINFGVNYTTLIHGTNTPKGRLIRIEVLVLTGAVLLLPLLFLGLYRRRSSRKAIKYIIWLAYTSSFPLVSYTIGLMQNSIYGNDLFSVWAISLFIVLDSVDSISAYSLKDNDEWKSSYVQFLISSFWVGWLVGANLEDSNLKKPIWFLFVLCVLRSGTRITSIQSASSSYLSKGIKFIANYMEREPNPSPESEVDPRNMKGYAYVVHGEDSTVSTSTSDDKFITVEKIWHCDGRLLKSGAPEGGRLKDLCLSFALSKLLLRRFYRYTLAEAHLPKTYDFIFKGLILEENGERVFRVIEVELAFIYDYLYTKYPLTLTNHIFVILSFTMTIPSIWLAVLLFKHYQNPNDDLTLLNGHKKNYDALVTFAVVVAIALLQLLQLLLSMSSDWLKVILVCKYIAKPGWQQKVWLEKFISLLGKIRVFKPWQNKLGQYDFLDSFDYKPNNVMHRLSEGLIDETREGQKQGEPFPLSSKVKQAILTSLRANHGNLTNGVTSLRDHGVSEQLSWACNLKKNRHSILVWHIATSLCENSSESDSHEYSGQEGTDLETCKEVATSLSRYCAYLIAFVPNLLQAQDNVSEFLWDEVIPEARAKLSGCKAEGIYEKMNSLGENDGNGVVLQGARLGKQLREGILEKQNIRWKLLAEFWAEMTIYLAPSDNATAHFDNIASGGEFITHLWTLLTHAGILGHSAEPQVV